MAFVFTEILNIRQHIQRYKRGFVKEKSGQEAHDIDQFTDTCSPEFNP